MDNGLFNTMVCDSSCPVCRVAILMKLVKKNIRPFLDRTVENYVCGSLEFPRVPFEFYGFLALLFALFFC